MDPRDAGMVAGVSVGGGTLILLSVWAYYRNYQRIRRAKILDEETILSNMPKRVHFGPATHFD